MRDDRILLQDMLDYARSATNFISGHVRQDLDSDQLLLLGLIRALEVIGEAASQVSRTKRTSLGTLPWREMIGMRNRLIHAYAAIDPDMVWYTVTNSLPPLIADLERILASEQETDNRGDEDI